MVRYHLSARAEADLLAIYDYTVDHFGSYQAEAYLAGLERIFGLLADFPGIGQSADHLAPGFRRFRFQSHYIFYTPDGDSVIVHAIPHTARDIRPELFE